MTVQIDGDLSSLGNEEALGGIEAEFFAELRKIEASRGVGADILTRSDGEVLARVIADSPCFGEARKALDLVADHHLSLQRLCAFFFRLCVAVHDFVHRIGDVLDEFLTFARDILSLLGGQTGIIIFLNLVLHLFERQNPC